MEITKQMIRIMAHITLQIRPMSEKRITVNYPIDHSFDVELANRLARLETYNKHYYRPNTYLHKWWARRCGTTFRLILKQLVTNPEQQDYYAPGGLEGKLILDPMMGGGTTLHEAIRLGANVIGMDLDPIPILQARATLTEYPLPELEEAFATLYASLRDDLAEYYQTTCPHCSTTAESWYLLYGARRSCSCGELLIVDSLIIRQEPDGSVIRLCAQCRRVLAGKESCDCSVVADVPLIERGTAVCPTCQQKYIEDKSAPYFTRYEPLVVSGHCPQHGLFLRSIDQPTSRALQRADDLRPQLRFRRQDFTVEPGRKSVQLLRRGIDNYLDLFSSRQLLVLRWAIDLLPHFPAPVQLNLALLLSTSLEFNSLLSGYKGKSTRRPGAIRHAFAHHAYSFPYTALENNPLYPRKSSGTLLKLFHARIRRGRSWAKKPRERDISGPKARFVEITGERDAGKEVMNFSTLHAGSHRFLLRQGSAVHIDLPDNSVDAIVTDPPYFDSVQYSDLSAFFRTWLRQMLPQFGEWHVDLQASAVDPHNNDRESRYAELLSQIFTECHRVLRQDDGRLIFTFHHWNPKGWAALTNGLKQAGFTLLNRVVVHSENPISVHIARMNALTHDAILVLATAATTRRSKWSRPAAIDTGSSAQFCTDCTTLLGWMLDSNLTADEIGQIWRCELD
jgi:putative DNA methylase